jgi:hypothetical protein
VLAISLLFLFFLDEYSLLFLGDSNTTSTTLLCACHSNRTTSSLSNTNHNWLHKSVKSHIYTQTRSERSLPYLSLSCNTFFYYCSQRVRGLFTGLALFSSMAWSEALLHCFRRLFGAPEPAGAVDSSPRSGTQCRP